MKILHVVTWMGSGGLENWLMNVLRNINRDKYQIDIVVQNLEQGPFDLELQEMGIEIHYCPGAPNPFLFTKNLLKILNNKKYDVVHSHIHHLSGYVLLIAYIVGIKGRIAHCHNVIYTSRNKLSSLKRF